MAPCSGSGNQSVWMTIGFGQEARPDGAASSSAMSSSSSAISSSEDSSAESSVSAAVSSSSSSPHAAAMRLNAASNATSSIQGLDCFVITPPRVIRVSDGRR